MLRDVEPGSSRENTMFRFRCWFSVMKIGRTTGERLGDVEIVEHAQEASKACFHRRGSTGVDDIELIVGHGSNLVLTTYHGDLGRHGFGRRVRISGTTVM